MSVPDLRAEYVNVSNSSNTCVPQARSFRSGVAARLRARRNEDGHILVLTGMLIAPLLVFAAFATDIGAWVTTASRMQRAADAAALAGAAELPDVAAATGVADEVMRRNGFDNGVDSVTLGIAANMMTGVTVDVADADPPMFFAGLVMPNLTLNRRAVARSRPALSLGSPDNFLGNDPIRGQSPNYWLLTYGPNATKENGDRYHTAVCGSATTVGCSSSPNGPVNDEYAPEGYFFESEVSSIPGTGPLRIEIFDPVFHNGNSTCNADWLLNPGQMAAQWWYTDNQWNLDDYPTARYEQGASNWCTGDSSTSNNFRMTVLVREPDDTTWTNTDNRVVCAMEFGSETPTSKNNFANKLVNGSDTFDRWVDSGSTLQSSPVTMLFRDYFRNWVPICDIANPQLGSYMIQVRTNADRSNRPSSLENADSNIASTGRNRYAMRTGWGSDPTHPQWNTGISLGAQQRLPIYINAQVAATGGPTLTEFTLVRATPAFAGEQIKVDFFDISDGQGDITLKIRPPTIFENGGGTITCSFTKSGVPKPETSECEIWEANSSGNGRIYQATINVPVDYTCDQTNAFDCWFRAEMTFSSQPHDATTWSAYAPGKPTRLTG